MSTSSLLKPLEAMHLSIEPAGNSTDANSLIELRAPNWHTPRHALFYAFNITEDWLLKYTEAHWKEHLHVDIADYDKTARVSCGVRMLQRVSGFPHLALKSGGPNDRAVAEGTLLPGTGRERIVPLLSMCSSRRRSYDNRPTYAQFDRLVEIMGKEPEWWVQHLTGDEISESYPRALATSTPPPLEIMPDFSTEPTGCNSTSDADSLIQLRAPNWRAPGRALYYAFNITEEWLLRYAEAHWAEYIPNLDIETYGKRTDCGVRILENASGCRYLSLESGVPNDRAVAENTFASGTGSERIVPLLVMYSSHQELLSIIPTRAQFDKLVQIVGKEPEWWVQHLTGDEITESCPRYIPASSSIFEPLEIIHISNRLVGSSSADTDPLIELRVPNWDTPKRALFYAFNITEEWLLQYTDSHWAEYIPHLPIEKYGNSVMSRVACGVWVMQQASGFPHLALKSGAPNERAIAEDTFASDTGEERIVPLLSMCSSRRRSYDNRPTRAQFDRLVQIVGKEPEWWVQHRTGDLN